MFRNMAHARVGDHNLGPDYNTRTPAFGRDLADPG